jgi:hypothetical protein
MMRLKSSDKGAGSALQATDISSAPSPMKGVVMGQATVDLPDPSEIPAAPQSSADDLLSQLAGEEIDRLLAEAEVEKNAAAPVTPQAPANPTDDLPPVAPISQSPAAPAQPAAEAAAKKPVVATPAEPHLEDQIQSLLDEATVKAATPEPAPVPQPPPAEIAASIADPSAAAKALDEALASGSADALPEVKIEGQTSPAEKSALASVTDAIREAEELAPAEEAPIPIFLRPLLWLNKPMEILPEGVRNFLVQAAILTLVNAIAVFVYVFLFRKHHH